MNWTKKPRGEFGSSFQKSTTRHGSLHANERFWVSLHVLYVLIKHCCAVFAFSRGCDRYVHAQVCIPRTALPISQINQVSLWITIKGDQKKVSESERAKAKQSSERQKNSDIDLSLPPRIHRTRQDPSITETSSILLHIMEAVRPVKNIHAHTHTHCLR